MTLKSNVNLFDKIIFYLLNVIFSKRYKSNFSRNFFKFFFNFFFKKINVENNIDLKSSKIIEGLNYLGWVKLEEKELNQNFIKQRDDAINSANKIFEANFKENKSDKSYLKNIDLLNHKNEVVIFHDFITNPFFIDIIKVYLEDKPLLTELKLLFSPPIKTQEFKGSQLFHSDFDDSKVVKLFIFLDDIDDEMGPTELIEKKESECILKLSKYNWGQNKNLYSSHDDNLENVLENVPKKIKLVGKKGSIYLVDTVNCLHRGSRNPSKSRKLLYANFTTRTSFRNPPINWIYNNHLTLLKSSPLLNLELQHKLNSKYIKNN